VCVSECLDQTHLQKFDNLESVEYSVGYCWCTCHFVKLWSHQWLHLRRRLLATRVFTLCKTLYIAMSSDTWSIDTTWWYYPH